MNKTHLLQLSLFIYTVIAYIFYHELSIYINLGILIDPFSRPLFEMSLISGFYVYIGSIVIVFMKENRCMMKYIEPEPKPVKRMGIRDISVKESVVLIMSILLVAIIFWSSAYNVFAANQETIITIKVFKSGIYTENSQTMTQVLTYGSGKYTFIGNWKQSLQVEHTYTLKYVRSYGGKHSYNNLIIIDLEEV